MIGSRHARLGVLASLLTCPLGQGCSPVIYEIATQMGSESVGPADHTGPSTGPTPPDPDPTPTEPTGPPDPFDSTGSTGTTDLPPGASTGPETTGAPHDCADDMFNGDETDVDCGGSCKPCGAGQACLGSYDCAFGECVSGYCQEVECTHPEECYTERQCLGSTCTEDGYCALVPADDGELCDNGDLCTEYAVCQRGTCIEVLPLDCSAFEGPCRSAVCNPKTGNCAVEWLYEDEPCDDGLDCTWFAQCASGVCVAHPPPDPLLFTDFSDAVDWKADSPWQIGPAIPSQCSPGGAEDPHDDHSPGDDRALAGAAIGECLPIDEFPDVCLESPPVDVSFMPGKLRLTYWSVLNTAGHPMNSRVEVFDSENLEWVPIELFEEFTAEGDWTEHTVDITAYKGPAVRVRFCHFSVNTTDGVGGWSIDDLSIGAPQCP